MLSTTKCIVLLRGLSATGYWIPDFWLYNYTDSKVSGKVNEENASWKPFGLVTQKARSFERRRQVWTEGCPWLAQGDRELSAPYCGRVWNWNRPARRPWRPSRPCKGRKRHQKKEHEKGEREREHVCAPKHQVH